MEAPTPLNPLKENIMITQQLSCENKEYKLEIIQTFEELIIKISPNYIEDCHLNYMIKYKLNDLYSLNKYFRQFDTIDEVVKALKNNEKMIKEKSKEKIYDINFENSNLIFKIHLYLMSGEIKLLSIKMNLIKLNEKEIIDKLKNYIKYIKSIPGVNELILSFENKSKKDLNKNVEISFDIKSNIIPNFKDFKFIYDEICKHLKKKEIKFIQRFNASKDGDSAKKFHEKCDNIGPNISIVKTKDNLIFGGFTVNNWSPQDMVKKDDLAFLFNYQTKKIHNITKGENAIYCFNNVLINFYNNKGGYSTLYLNDNCFNRCSNTCQIKDSSYTNFIKDYELNNGNLYFKVSEFGLYEIM